MRRIGNILCTVLIVMIVCSSSIVFLSVRDVSAQTTNTINSSDTLSNSNLQTKLENNVYKIGWDSFYGNMSFSKSTDS